MKERTWDDGRKQKPVCLMLPELHLVPYSLDKAWVREREGQFPTRVGKTPVLAQKGG